MPRYAQLVMGPAGSGKVRRVGEAGGGNGDERALKACAYSVCVPCRARTAPPCCSTARRWAAPCRWLTWTRPPSSSAIPSWQVSALCAYLASGESWGDRSLSWQPCATHVRKRTVVADIRELIEVDDVMEDDSLRFGPNGGLVFCMEYFANNFNWLEESLGHVEDDYILFDCPGKQMYVF